MGLSRRVAHRSRLTRPWLRWPLLPAAAVALAMILDGLAPALAGATQAPLLPGGVAIGMDQAGYLPGESKVGCVWVDADRQPSQGWEARILKVSEGLKLISPLEGASPALPSVPAEGQSQDSPVVWQSRLGPWTRDPEMPRLWVAVADFSSLRQPGTYVLQVLPAAGFSATAAPTTGPAWVSSPAFVVSTGILNDLYVTTARSYTLQRCGVAIDDPLTGVRHAACHQEDAVLSFDDGLLKKGTVIPAVGGWHDAGDYGKYVTTTTITVAQMLLTWEMAQAGEGMATRLSWADPTKVTQGNPGSAASQEGSSHSLSLLDEARWGLNWLFCMQRPDGAVYHKLGPAQWPGFIAPEDDDAPRYIYGLTTQDTAKFAATCALAARVFAGSDPQYAARALFAAKKAWEYLQAHGYQDIIHAGDNNGSGPYDDTSDLDDRFWAASELAVATGWQEPYRSYVLEHMDNATAHEVSWMDSSLIGIYHLLKDDRTPADVRTAVAEALRVSARGVWKAAQSVPYHLSLQREDFAWASNKVALARGMLLVLAADTGLAGDARTAAEYRNVARAQLHWVLGMNPLKKSFVTGVGQNAVAHPHHRLVGARGRIIPGLLVGGPNSNAEDGVAPKGLGPLSYLDVQASYATNEPAIDYNAPLVFLASYFAAVMD